MLYCVSGYQKVFYPRRVLLFLALLASMVESSISPQQVHFQASKERTKS